MSDNKMTAEQALEWIDVYGFALDTQTLTACIEVLRAALSAPRVPDNIEICRICEKCNQDYKLPFVTGGAAVQAINHMNCPNCGERDDPWILVRSEILAASPEPVAPDQQVIADPSPADDMETQLAAKDWVIGNMQLKDSEQEAEIADLRAEVEALKETRSELITRLARLEGDFCFDDRWEILPSGHHGRPVSREKLADRLSKFDAASQSEGGGE